MSFPLRDIGILPLVASTPFVYFPRVVDGDTQPWIVLAALFAFLTFRTERLLRKQDISLIVLALMSVLAYAFRGSLGFDLLRQAYTYLSFLLIWTICRREQGDYFPMAVRLTIVVWFLVGLLQYISVQLGQSIDMFGRFIEGRSGVPSLTAESSYYGSLSVLQLMYLMSGARRTDWPYAALAVLSVVLSGSLLALALLVFPLFSLPVRIRLAAGLLVPLLVLGDYLLSTAGATARLVAIASGGFDAASILFDPSINLRLGHIYFTLVENVVPSLFLMGPVRFMEDYNAFAAASPLFIPTGSNYILPAIGEIVYGAGLPGLLLLAAYLKLASEASTTVGGKVQKIVFIVVCMLNPIQLSNIFLNMYAQRRV